MCIFSANGWPTFQKSFLCLQNLRLQAAHLTNERAWIMTKRLSNGDSINLLILGLCRGLSPASLSVILCSIRKVLCRRAVVNSNHYQGFLKIHIQKYIWNVNHVNIKGITSVFPLLRNNFCQNIFICWIFFTVFHTTYHSRSLSTKKNYQSGSALIFQI